ncbi:putative non-specific serine/threonine protein kinase [Helianthus annuus]|uniref:Non-specific serine/threonine protein kinase n=1 Tax=Helianthus annuus TaxID=4232 RepID=A0A9K3IV42_HELAN|nr:putative non-specific serine/threonine protein kinase [Helianthus annuus]KAJ0561492.1 putative non-specific serine/threonine protein kinase [Helianthus annuus]KAJ0568153.1 putative non-specific serine/threonine protein kinase [Helianthus annuus]KAJ0574549.1 putative non-specific serine/threonine protein kinase [Helianthus annuus]KAJ0738881.1 putative non-specific serine/threonine protein kinase [Helianthus annuus]
MIMLQKMRFLILCFVPLFPTLCFCYEARNPEVAALIAVKNGLDDPHGAFSNWDEDSVDPCSWARITCSPDNLVTGLDKCIYKVRIEFSP